MDFEMPKFDKRNPETQDQKLILELVKDLMDVTKAFVELNKANLLDHDLFLILRDGSVAFAGQSLGFLAEMLGQKDQVPLFTDEAKKMFNCYMQQINMESKK